MQSHVPPDVPAYVKELMQPTPSGIRKLLAAWDGISPETQMLILSKFDEVQAPPHLIRKVYVKALDSRNAYVRYLAARNLKFERSLSEEERVLKNRIENDPEPLVKYALLENPSSLSVMYDEAFKDADSFFALPQEARLAKLRLIVGGGKWIAGLLSEAVDKHLKDGTVSEVELYEILADYLTKPAFRERYANTQQTYDGYNEYTKGSDIESLWELVPKLPGSLSVLLIENLPEASGLKTEIPKEVIDAMTDTQVELLLSRKDVGLKELRKKIFWEEGDRNERLRSASIRVNFSLDNDEFAKLLTKPPKERIPILEDLGMMAQDLRLCIYDAIHDALFASDASLFGGDYEYALLARDHLKRRLEELEDWERESELTDLRLYRLAQTAVPWDSSKTGSSPSGVLNFLAEEIVAGDTWATFTAFFKAWRRKQDELENEEDPIAAKNNLLRYLPRIYEIKGDNTDLDLFAGIDQRLKDIRQAVDSTSVAKYEDLLASHEQNIVEKQEYRLKEYTDAFQTALNKLQVEQKGQRKLMYTITALLILILIAVLVLVLPFSWAP
ncbi:MAG: hypothetical protein QNI91_01615 [Arenicellales bacterium]|nr:hypothetical protein [Arenicellales bacterium]